MLQSDCGWQGDAASHSWENTHREDNDDEDDEDGEGALQCPGALGPGAGAGA